MEELSIFDEGSGAESSESTDVLKERMTKRIKEQKKAAKKDDARARKARLSDNKISVIISKILKLSSDNELVKFLSKAIKKNIPSYFLIMIISLNNKDLSTFINARIKEDEIAKKHTNFLEKINNNMPDCIITWASNLCDYIDIHKDDLSEDIIDHNQWVVYNEISELSYYVLTRYLEKNNITFDKKEVNLFVINLFKHINDIM